VERRVGLGDPESLTITRLGAVSWPGQQFRDGAGVVDPDDFYVIGVHTSSAPQCVYSGELFAAQLPKVIVMHDASDGSQMASCSREPPGGN
jgi:hypothetical protein